MRLLLLLSALLAVITGATTPARAVVGVERSAALAARPTRAVAAAPAADPFALANAPDRAVTAVVPLPLWSIAPATPRWIERLRV